MHYGQLETEITNRLNDYFTSLSVSNLFEAKPIPENDSEGIRAFIKGTVYIQYLKSSYQPTQSLNSVSQPETIILRLTFDVQNLRQANGFYNLIDHVKKSLLGYRPSNATTRLVIDEYDLLQYENNSVQPYLQMKCDALNVQDIDEEEYSDDLFKNLTIKD